MIGVILVGLIALGLFLLAFGCFVLAYIGFKTKEFRWMIIFIIGGFFMFACSSLLFQYAKLLMANSVGLGV